MLEKEQRLPAETPIMFSTLITPPTVLWTDWQGASSVRSAQAVLVEFCRMPIKIQRWVQAPLVYSARGAANPTTEIVQGVPAMTVTGLLLMMSWQGVVGSTWQAVLAELIMQQASFWKRSGEQQDGKLTIQSTLWSTLICALVMVKTTSCLQPSVLKQEAMEMLLVTRFWKVGKMTLAQLLTTVQVKSESLRQIMLKAPLVWLAGVQMPLMVMVQLPAVSWVGSAKENTMRQLTLSRQQRGQRTVPSWRVTLMLSRSTSVFMSLRSCPITKANCSSVQSGRGKQNTMVIELQLNGFRYAYMISVREMQLSPAIVVVRMRTPVSITNCSPGSYRYRLTLCDSAELLMPMPQTTRVKVPAGQNCQPVMATVTFLLSELEVQVTGMAVPLATYRQQMLVDTVIPLSDSRMQPFASRGLEVPKTTVQQVLTTPSALSWQVTTKDCSGD